MNLRRFDALLTTGVYMGTGHGFGKTILFGEHFVVHGVPSIAAAIGKKTVAKVTKSPGTGYILHDNRLATPGYKKDKLDQQKDSIERVLKAAGVETSKTKLDITFEGDLVAASGVGASAASCVALARALSDEFKLGFSDEKVNSIAYEGEKVYHGTPSGIDNTASTYGGLIWFKKGTPTTMEKIKVKAPVEIVLGNTGLVTNTEKAVAGVAERKAKQPEKYAQIFTEAGALALKARKSLEVYDLKAVGKLMNENHKLLQSIEVSCKELDLLVDISMKNGAFGAKMTGGGLGGNIVALTPGKELQNKVANALESAGFETVRTVIGV